MKIRLAAFSCILVIFSFLSVNKAYSQDGWWKEKKYKSEATRIKYAQCKKAFTDIGTGLSSGNVNFINTYFNSEVYLNVISNEKGYYSASQAELILIDFMDYFRISSFKYTRSYRDARYAYANGFYRYNKGMGKRELNVTISLKYTKDGRWLIDQININ
jgi:hypothetical protein